MIENFTNTHSWVSRGLICYVLIAALITRALYCLPNHARVGILLHEGQYEQEMIFRWSIDQINQRGILNNTRIIGDVARISAGDSWDAERKTCQLLEDGAIAIVGPSLKQTSQHIGSICDALDVPHFNVITKGMVYNSQPTGTNLIVGSAYPSLPGPTYQSSISVDLSISRSIMMQAYIDLLHSMEWTSFVYFYEHEDSLYSLQEHLKGNSLKSSQLNMKILRFNPKEPYRETFRLLKRSTRIKHIMLDIQCSNLKTVLKHAQQVSLMTEAHCYIIVCLDTQTYDLEDFKHSRSRLVWLTVTDQSSEALRAMQVGDLEAEAGINIFGSSFRFDPRLIKTESALIHDAVETMALTLQGVDIVNLRAPVSCNKSKPWLHGSTIVNYMRTSVELNGMTGRIRFDPTGQRSDYGMNVVLLSENGPKVVGSWHPRADSSIRIDRQDLQYLRRGDSTMSDGDNRETLIVSSIKNTPYFMDKLTSKVETGNSRYEGYAVDLIEELSRIVGFDYVFKEVSDGKYGIYDISTKTWNGMIREVMVGEADLAIGDLSITSDREDAVDFTLPFMSTGISILFKKPITKELELFSFLSPFETHVWIYVCGAYIGVSLLLFIVGRISPYEWADPHPCRQEDKILRNQFSLTNSFWFTIAALMQQGSDLAPRSLSTRLVSAIWYFFTLIMISSYTANLAAFLTVEKVVSPFERAEELYHHPQNIKYGCVGSGSTRKFFEKSKPSSTFHKMVNEMVYAKRNDDGILRVEEGNYAFFMESASIEYTIERHCNLTQVGGLLDSKGYGIALAKNSTRRKDYRTLLSYAILSLQEAGQLEILKNRWWREKRGGGACDADDGQGGDGVKELTLANVGGVFVVLGMGVTTSFILCGLELYAKSYKSARARGTNKWEQAMKRVRFALAFSDNY